MTATNEDRQKLHLLRKQACFYAEAECQFFSQKLIAKNLIDGDKGTKFFHDLVKKSNRDMSISCILNQNRQPTSWLAQVGDLFIDFFKDLLGSSRNRMPSRANFLSDGPLISSSQHAVLTREVSNQEIKHALFDRSGSDHLARLFLLTAFKKNKFNISMVYDLLRHRANVAVCWKFAWRSCIPRKFSFIFLDGS
nr:protein TAR1-like [Ipomoea batatas]